ncbi:MAG: membrane protein insertase YidC, partial [Gammaproteobacteria bacterium]
MDNLRVFLWAALASLIWITAQTWQQDYGTKPPELPVPEEEATAVTAPVDLGLPELTAAEGTTKQTTGAELPVSPETGNFELAPSILVKTDVLELGISLDGGTLETALLPLYPKHKDQPDVPVQLLSGLPGDLYVLRSGVRAAEDRAEANHTVRFSTGQNAYELGDGAEVLEVPLRWQSEDGIVVEKIYRLRRGNYAIEL